MFNLIARVTCLLIVLTDVHPGSASNHWNYTHEDEWPLQCKEGTKQSPIALSRDVAQEENFSSLIFEEYDATYPVQLINNGHSVEIRPLVSNRPTVRGGGLPHVYNLDHVHFHWESEHILEGTRLPLELHFVNYASEYFNLSEALKHTGGVAVFSVLFYLSPDSDMHFQPLINIIDQLLDAVGKSERTHVNIDNFLPRDRAGFYRYNGSLTTPACTEGVIWTVFTNMLPISQAQVESFPLLQSDDAQKVVKNYRSVQPLNGRRVLIRTSPVFSSAISNMVDPTFGKLMFGLLFLYLLILF